METMQTTINGRLYETVDRMVKAVAPALLAARTWPAVADVDPADLFAIEVFVRDRLLRRNLLADPQTDETLSPAVTRALDELHGLALSPHEAQTLLRTISISVVDCGDCLE